MTAIVPLLINLLTFLLSSCGAAPAKPDPAHEVKRVSIITVEPRDIPVSFESIAQTQSSHLVNIQSRVNGFLDQIVYTEGKTVKKGDVLFLIDPKPFQEQVDIAKAALKLHQATAETSRLNLNRVQPLVKQNALSQKDLDDAVGSFDSTSAMVEQAKAQLATANLNLSYCTITSPIDGVTSSALQQEGAYVSTANSQLTTVSAITPIWVNFSLSENQMTRFHDDSVSGRLVPPKDDRFVVRIIQSNGEPFAHLGYISFTEPYYNEKTGTFLIRSTVDNPEGILRPNQYVRAQVEGAVRPQSILVPQRSVLQSSKGTYVWVVDQEEKVEFRPITVGDWHGNDWFILEGLRKGDRVVVDGVVGLRQGQTVRVVS